MALHKLAMHPGKLNLFLRREKGDKQNLYNSKENKDNDSDHVTLVIATIVGGINDKGLNTG